MREEAPSYSGTIHTAHRILIHEASRDNSCSSIDTPASLPRTKGRSITCRPIELEPCFMKDKAEPHLITANTDVPISQTERRAESSDMLRVCSRVLLQNTKRKVQIGCH